MLQEAFEPLALPSEVRSDDKQTFAIVEFVEYLESPRSFNQAQLDDWLECVEQSGMPFDLDVGDGDETLDNFVIHDGQLRWVDGNMIYARPLHEQEQSTSEMHSRVLQRFVASE